MSIDKFTIFLAMLSQREPNQYPQLHRGPHGSPSSSPLIPHLRVLTLAKTRFVFYRYRSEKRFGILRSSLLHYCF